MSESLQQLIERHEGLVKYAYEDSEGYLTIGIGRLIDQRRGGKITIDEARYLLQNDLREVRRDILDLFPKNFPTNTSEARTNALCDMRFQLGYHGFRSFENMIENIRKGDWDAAADSALNSLWAQQTPVRAKEIAQMLREG